MHPIIISLSLIFVAIAFVAAIVSGLLKLIFFLKRKDTYRHLLKFGLLGEIIGLLIMFMIWMVYRKEMNDWTDLESTIAIPFYLMLAGQIVGSIVVFRKKRGR